MTMIEGRGRRGRINFAMIFPSLRSNRSLSLDLLRQTTKRNHQTIAFSGSHLGSELTAFYAARQGVSIRVHRAGLAPAMRKEVEQQFKSGKLGAISATPTLELGIDIGDVDAIISNIVPINRLVQRVGRGSEAGTEGIRVPGSRERSYQPILQGASCGLFGRSRVRIHGSDKPFCPRVPGPCHGMRQASVDEPIKAGMEYTPAALFQKV